MIFLKNSLVKCLFLWVFILLLKDALYGFKPDFFNFILFNISDIFCLV